MMSGFLSAGVIGADSGDAIPDSGITRLTFDAADTSGSTATDVWGDNDGSINGATTGVSGANQTYTTSEAYDFGGDDYVSTGLNFGSVSSLSVAAWVNADNVSDLQGIAGQISFVGDGEGFALGLNSGNLRWQLSHDSTSSFIESSASTGTWYHVIGVYGAGAMELYVDGSSVGIDSGPPSSIDPVPDFNVGRRPISDDAYLDGAVDDVRVFDKRLSDTEASSLYNTGSI